MAKNARLIRQFFQNRTAKAARQRLENANTKPVNRRNEEDCPKLSSLILILTLAMLAGIFVVKSLA